jgi:WD40 repeat protein
MRHFRAGKGVVNALAFTPCGRTLHCIESKDLHAPHEAVHWLDVERGQLARTLDLNEEVRRHAFSTGDARNAEKLLIRCCVSPDGRWVAARCYSHYEDVAQLELWDARTDDWCDVPVAEGNPAVPAVCFSLTSDVLVVASAAGEWLQHTIERLDLIANVPLPALEFPGSEVTRLCLPSDELLLGVVCLQAIGVLAHEGDFVALELEPTHHELLRFLPNSHELVIVDRNHLFLWDCQSPEAEQVPDVDEGITDLAFAPDGELWALGYTDGTVRLRTREREVARFDWGIGRVASVAFAPDGLTCAAGGENGQIVLWDVDA